jgi:hypothetical protein
MVNASVSTEGHSGRADPGAISVGRPTPARYPGAGRLEGKVAIVTGGDSGIGRAVSVLFAREGAEISIVYLEENEDAAATAAAVRKEGRECLTIAGDIAREEFCCTAVKQTIEHFGKPLTFTSDPSGAVGHGVMPPLFLKVIHKGIDLLGDLQLYRPQLAHRSNGARCSTCSVLCGRQR